MCRENFKFFTIYSVCVGIFLPFVANAENLQLMTAVQNAKTACSGIDDNMAHLKMMAGINTAVTAVGTVGAGVALSTGIAKTNVDQEKKTLEEKVARLIAAKSNIPIETIEIANQAEFRRQLSAAVSANNVEFSAEQQKINELEQKSKTLGNIRTGTLAASTATNIAGTAIAATNKIDTDLEAKINKCVASVKELATVKLTAKIENTATDTELANAERIISACRDYEYIDTKPINKHAIGAAIASGVGVGTGIAGTITSAAANSEKTRAGDEKREKNLNTAANVMAGATTIASATATIFNATQIAAIKKVATVAQTCEGALK